MSAIRSFGNIYQKRFETDQDLNDPNGYISFRKIMLNFP